jgi:bifunctional UDP-N-acetylglucosamine pyrophosphorylase/glucosamine-1-phosphate N-acetyltransferase
MDRAAAVILAAGKGMRMRSERAKVLHEVCGRPLLAFVLDTVTAAGISPMHIVVGYQGEDVKERFKESPAIWITQEERLGTGHALLMAEPLLGDFDGEVVVLCGDAPLVSSATLQGMLKKHRETESSCTVLTCEIPDPTGYGRVLRDDKGQVRAIVEHNDADESELAVREVNSGAYVFAAAAVFPLLRRLKPDNKQKEYYLTDVLPLMLRKGHKVSAYLAPDGAEILGANSRQDLAMIDGILRRRVIDALMEKGVTIVDPSKTYIEAGVKIGRDTVVYPFTVIRSGVIVGSNCEVGPFSHLRSGTKIEDHAEVGNFVEVKKSKIGLRSKAKHLSYIGDALIGDDVNIGAGTITANYDGSRKHQTVIEDEASTGSGTVLVAPVKLGKGATTGAGAVVTRGCNVPDRAVVVGVPARLLKKTAQKGREAK